MYTSFPLFSD